MRKIVKNHLHFWSPRVRLLLATKKATLMADPHTWLEKAMTFIYQTKPLPLSFFPLKSSHTHHTHCPLILCLCVHTGDSSFPGDNGLRWSDGVRGARISVWDAAGSGIIDIDFSIFAGIFVDSDRFPLQFHRDSYPSRPSLRIQGAAGGFDFRSLLSTLPRRRLQV